MVRISSGYSAYSADALAQLFQTNKSAAKSKKSDKNDLTNQNLINNQIEKHIDDVKKGRYEASKGTANLLGSLNASANDLLSKSGPKLLSMYSGYVSAFRYDRAARFVSGVEHGLSNMPKVEA